MVIATTKKHTNVLSEITNKCMKRVFYVLNCQRNALNSKLMLWWLEWERLPQARLSACLVPTLRSCDLDGGGVPWGWGFKSQDSPNLCVSVSLSLFSVPCLPASLHILHKDNNGVTSEIVSKPSPNQKLSFMSYLFKVSLYSIRTVIQTDTPKPPQVAKIVIKSQLEYGRISNKFCWSGHINCFKTSLANHENWAYTYLTTQKFSS